MLQFLWVRLREALGLPLSRFVPADDSVLQPKPPRRRSQQLIAPDYLGGPLGSCNKKQLAGATTWEYQIRSTLIHVVGDPEPEARTAANKLLPQLWAERRQAIAAAELEARRAYPDFWSQHDAAGTSAEQLAVWLIWIDLAGGAVEYEVGDNFDASTRQRRDLPHFEDIGGTITVSRSADGRFEAESALEV